MFQLDAHVQSALLSNQSENTRENELAVRVLPMPIFDLPSEEERYWSCFGLIFADVSPISTPTPVAMAPAATNGLNEQAPAPAPGSDSAASLLSIPSAIGVTILASVGWLLF